MLFEFITKAHPNDKRPSSVLIDPDLICGMVGSQHGTYITLNGSGQVYIDQPLSKICKRLNIQYDAEKVEPIDDGTIDPGSYPTPLAEELVLEQALEERKSQ